MVGYRLGLAVVAVLMVLLPALYVGLILLAGWGVWYHAANDLFLLQGPGVWLRLLYFGPIIVGLVVILFMVKPLFARQAPAAPAMALDADEERLLFSFIERIARLVGAAPPRRVEVNCAANAAAGFCGGARGVLGRDMTLTLGLPLVAGLDTRQFAGVLAHELGHFSQGAGMRLTYVIRTVNHWFYRVVNERDQWDLVLDCAARDANFWSGVVVHPTRGGIWLGRRILWALMQAGHAVSCYMLRQMEYDADRHECQVAGSVAFRQTMVRLMELNVATGAAFDALQDSWRAQRLPDSLPEFIVGTSTEIPTDVREETERRVAESKTGVFDTHPCDTDRIRAADALDAPGVVRSTAPATALFRDFPSLSRQATRFSYEKEHALPVQDRNLVDTATCLRESRSRRATRALAERYFGGVCTVFHPITIELPELQPPSDLEAGLAELRSARDRMHAAVARARRAQEDHDQIADRLITADCALAALTAGVTIPAPAFGLEAGTREEAVHTIARLERQRTRSGAPLGQHSACARARLQAALRQLICPSQAGRIPDAGVLQAEVARLVPVLVALGPALPLLHELGRRLSVWQFLLGNPGQFPEPFRLDGAVEDVARQVQGLVARVSRGISGVAYPFPHARGAVTLEQFVEPDAPSEDGREALFNQGMACLERLYPLYDEVVGRLAQVAARVEETLAPEGDRRPEGEGGPAADLLGRLREVASRLGPEALAARRPPAGTRS